MKALRNPATLLVSFLLVACSTTPTNPPANQSLVSLDDSAVQAPTFVMRGQVVLGRESQSFMPCDSQHQYWLDVSDDKLRQLKPLITAPYEPLYTELVGHLATPSHTGLDADFTARFVVDHFNFVSADNPELCSQPAKSTRVVGQEPFWSLKFAKQRVTLTQANQKPQLITRESTRISQDQRFYKLDDGFLQLDKQSCSDGMSDNLYGWSAEFKHNGKTLHGCAATSNFDATRAWSSTYQAQATDSTHFTVTLTLNSDHSATTTYGYQNGDADTVEKGYWQQLNDRQVQVVMTHHQRQYLLSERIFTLDADKLIADKEKVGTVVYEITDGGLTLFKAQQ
ncbi:Uncharacterized membrane protein [Vibrio xiamenensis]|uniref:Uncharacterized membrane protein n=1 Tax=Vibrio xiamenensis TaxID=861298 RepID=A0A1G8G285_9VIBR|nr:hypothetical protein [Vibrio xiamenensis]SDH88471.1 Uncharacterized membrane protein [Vibrio xiamenensis]